MKRLTYLLAAAGVAFACSKDSTSVDHDAIDGRELAAVRSALDTALKNDSSYQILRVFVFAYVDRASRIPTGAGDTLRLVGVQLDVNATKADTPVMAGTGSGFVIHQAPDSSVHVWLARTGALHVTGNNYGSGTSTSGSGLTITTSRGTVSGDYHLMGKLVPDSSTTVTSAVAFGGGIRGLLIRITGKL